MLRLGFFRHLLSFFHKAYYWLFLFNFSERCSLSLETKYVHQSSKFINTKQFIGYIYEVITMEKIMINQSVAILCDGNNIERSIHELSGSTSTMINFDKLIQKLLSGRGLNRLIYFREGKNISSKLAERLYERYNLSANLEEIFFPSLK